MRRGRFPCQRLRPRLLAGQTSRRLMIKKVAGMFVQIARDEVSVSWNISVRGITHVGNLIEVATKPTLTKNSIYCRSHYVSEAAERSIFLRARKHLALISKLLLLQISLIVFWIRWLETKLVIPLCLYRAARRKIHIPDLMLTKEKIYVCWVQVPSKDWSR